MVKDYPNSRERLMTGGRSSPVSSGHAEGQQADSASALVEMITRRRELERTGRAPSASEAVCVEPAGRGDTDASNAPGVCGDVSGAQPVGHNQGRRKGAVSAAGQGAMTSAADALLAVFAIEEEQWAKLLADLPLDTLTELLGHVFRLYQRIATEETNRRFEQGSVRPLEPFSELLPEARTIHLR
jgi:hypothetical protein